MESKYEESRRDTPSFVTMRSFEVPYSRIQMRPYVDTVKR